MNTPVRATRIPRSSYSTALIVLLFAVAAIAVPFSAGSRARVKVPKVGPSSVPIAAHAENRFPSLLALAETIETFAADCTTPKSAFYLGETVCAKTDGVDTNYAGGRWVHWLRQNLSIAHGGSGTTLITQNPQFFSFVPDQTGTWKVTIAETGDDSQTPASFTVAAAPESIATYDSTCNLAQDNFTLNMGSVTVCAKADANYTGTRYIYWVNSQGDAIQTDVLTSPMGSATRTMTEAGNFWVYFSDSDGLRSRHGFTVSDPQEPKVDISVSKSRRSGDVVAGGFITYDLLVANKGPDTASTVELTDAVPLNATYVSSTQNSGPAFTRTQETPTTTWTIASLPAGNSASFTFVYQVGSVAAGTFINNSASVSSTTGEIHAPDNTSEDFATVVGGTSNDCSLDCPNDIVTTATTSGPGGGANVTFGAPEGFGSCGTITNEPASGSFFPIGTTTVVSTSSTGGGGCSFTVTVVDSAAPTITCPANIAVTANQGDSQAFVPNPNGSSSNVGAPVTTGDSPLEVTGSREDGDALTGAYPFGVTDITWIATDPSGRQASCTQKITVVANQVLTISCPANISQSTAGCDPVTVNVGTPTSNSGTATVVGRRSDNLAYSTDAAFNDPYPIGTTTISWSASDVDTQSASCEQTVTITSTSGGAAPTLDVPPSVTVTTSSCSATLDDELGVATADSSCGTVNITRTGIPQIPCPIPGNPGRTCDSFVFPTGTTVITYTATGPGGTTTGTQTVTVLESPATSPTITAPADLTLNTGPGAATCGTFIGDATLGTATASDNCPGVTVTRSGVPAGNNFPVGTTTVTYRATDRVGNFTEDTQTVTVVDNTPPVITPPANITVYLPLNSTATSMAVNYPNPATATDNCGGTVTIGYSPVSGSVFSVGTTTVTITATDSTNNSSTSTFTVTVLYNFTGFFSPIGNPPVLNAVNAGRAIPVKFSLSGNKGLNIFAADSPYTVSYNCATNDPGVDITETTTAGGSSLSYSPDTYHYTWKTESSWAGTCRQLVVTLNDGSVHVANFKFK